MSEQARIESICAVVVTHNRLSLLKECLDAISSQTRPVSKILVVDNDSMDGTREWLAKQSDIWTISQNNLGAAGGFRRGIKEAVEAGFSAVWIMDDDVVPKQDALEALSRAASRVGVFGFLASRATSISGHPLNLPRRSKVRSADQVPPSAERTGLELVRVDIASFVSLLIPAVNVHEFGLPIADMFIWGDDTEYTRRLSMCKPCYWVLDSEVLHKRANQTHLSISKETDKQRIEMFWYYYRNNLYAAVKIKNLKDICNLLFLSGGQVVKAAFSRSGCSKIKVILGGLVAGVFFRPRQ